MELPKILAVYLPQFHCTTDNDRWWGEGFTDWDTVKTAEPYFERHIQPKVPLYGNYDLLKKETLQKQSDLARKYGIDGFCFYHYYFKDGKLELNLPAENLLKWKDIDMPFCFNWASEPWIRSWSRIPGNVWAEKYDNAGELIESGILVSQDYGSKKEWENHFNYLLPFFKDKRYIKVDEKPVFVFYSPDDIRCIKPMTECWRYLAKKNGFDDLYLIGARMTEANKCLDAALVYEPRYAMNILNEEEKIIINNGVRCFDYKDIWDKCTEAENVKGMHMFYSGVVDYDDTPRRGRSGECFIDVSSRILKNGMERLMLRATANKSEFVFINAWNEWGEGMYLEPDSVRGYEMLEAIKDAKVDAGKQSMLVSDIYTHEKKNDQFCNDLQSNMAKKFKELFEVADRWLFLEQEGRFCLKDYLQKKGYCNFAIYGMASLGKHLLIGARKEGIEPDFGIDRYVGQFGDNFKVYRPEEELPDTDCIIVTAYDYENINASLTSKVNSSVIYIGDVLNEMYMY